MQTFIPGWQAQITINVDDLTVVGNVLSIGRTRASLPKPVFGTPFRHEIVGQAAGTIAASGHLSAEVAPKLEALFAAATGHTYAIQIGVLGEDTDGGILGGILNITEYTIDDDAEGQWSWAITATMDGEPLYTPAV